MMSSSRTNYSKCVCFLACVGDGLDPNGIKERMGLSRYSFDYTLNKLLRLGLVALEGEVPRLTERGANVIRYRVNESARRDVAELKVAQKGL